MVRAWQIKASKRTWRTGVDVVLLIEPCKVFNQLGPKAASLLGEAPVADVGPGIIPQLYAQTWARPVVDKWALSSSAIKTTKMAIQQAQKANM
jgi:hypothetical protein